MKGKKNEGKWTLVQRSRIPIKVQWGDIAVAFVVDDQGVLDFLWVEEGDQHQWEVSRDGQDHFWQGYTFSGPQIENGARIWGGQNPRTGYSSPYRGSNRQRREMLGSFRQVIGTCPEPLPEWAKRTWDQGLDLIRAAIPPLRIAGLEVNQGDSLSISLTLGSIGADAAYEIQNLAGKDQLSLSDSFRSNLQWLIYSGWAKETGDSLWIVVTLTPKFDEESLEIWNKKIQPALKSVQRA